MSVTWRSVFVRMEPAGSSLTARAKIYLPTDVKHVSAVQLMGYKLTGFGATSAISMDIKEVRTNNNTLLSNDPHVNGNFYVLYHRPSSTAATAEYVKDSSALACISFTPRNMPTLTVELKDLDNNVIEMSQPTEALFWMRILVESH